MLESLEGFPAITGLLDGPALLAANVAKVQPARLLQLGEAPRCLPGGWGLVPLPRDQDEPAWAVLACEAVGGNGNCALYLPMAFIWGWEAEAQGVSVHVRSILICAAVPPFPGVCDAIAQLLCSLADVRAPPGGSASELSPGGLLALLQSLLWCLRLEAASVQLFSQHPQLAPTLLQLLQPPVLFALGRFVAATGSRLGVHHRPAGCHGERSLADAAALWVMAAAVGALFAPFTHGHALPQLEAPLLQLQQALAGHPAAVPALLHCLEAAPVGAAAAAAGAEAAPEGVEELLGSSVGLLARLVMVSDRAVQQFVAAGGMAPPVVGR